MKLIILDRLILLLKCKNNSTYLLSFWPLLIFSNRSHNEIFISDLATLLLSSKSALNSHSCIYSRANDIIILENYSPLEGTLRYTYIDILPTDVRFGFRWARRHPVGSLYAQYSGADLSYDDIRSSGRKMTYPHMGKSEDLPFSKEWKSASRRCILEDAAPPHRIRFSVFWHKSRLLQRTWKLGPNKHLCSFSRSIASSSLVCANRL